MTQKTAFSFLAELNNVNSLQVDLKDVSTTDAGATDVIDKAGAVKDVSFNTMRNAINRDGNVTGTDVANYIKRAEELNDEIDTIAFGIETDDDHVIKVYVNAEQAEKFEEALSNMLGLEEDIEDALNALTADFDIVDIVWPTESEETPDSENVPTDPDSDDAEIANALGTSANAEDEIDEEDDFEVVAALPTNTPDNASDTTDQPNSQEISSDDLPDLPAEGDEEEDEKPSPWEQLDAIVTDKFKDDETIASVADLSLEQMSQVIDIEKADEIAIAQYDAADFMALEADEREDIINANPDLILGTEEEEVPSEEPEEGDENLDDAEAKATAEIEADAKKEVSESRKFSFLASLQ